MAHYPTVDTSPPELEAASVEQPFLAAGQSSNTASQRLGYHSGRRSYRDAFFLVLFLTALGATVGIGIYGILHRNRDFLDLVGKDSLNDPANCPAYHTDNVTLLNHLRSNEATLGALAKAFLTPVAVTLGASVVLGLILLWLLKTVPFFLVYATVSLVVLSPALGGLAAYSLARDDRQRDPQIVLYPAGATAVLAFVFWYIRDKLALTARLLGCSAAALRENLSLLTFVALVQVFAVVIWVPIPALIGVAYTDGRLAPNPDLKPGQACGANYDVTCCAWQPKSWFPAYAALAGVVALWLAALVNHIQSFTVAGVIAQWYFAELGHRRRAPICKNLRYAVGPSLGTLCLSSLVVTVISLVKDALENAKQKLRESGGENLLLSCVVCCFEAILSGIEFVTKFTIITVAITGDSFCSAAARTFVLLRRNLLSSVTVDSVSIWVLNLGTFVLSAAWGTAVGLFCSRQWSHHNAPGFDREDAGALGAVEGQVCFLVAFALLRLFSQLLLSVVDTVYICFALDKNQGDVTRRQVHEIYEKLPSVKKGRHGEDYEAAQGNGGQPYYASAPPVPGLPAHNATRGEPVTGYPLR
ncbi:hypothetical protein KFL_008560040 [Klebsormidium nitens]|uniref:Choline transporter-like protein n=1 Tax=Klebsormidium nitens TaxID=105231 RepID=A0A1Y1ILX3_KLENI|nr:hypothetical protein KFL_008560040 [Klebsormidium nitens]|eukprot:GAQ91794.1 hypothetical protein KFL_008560040 [Klebsormidium nitens]